MNEKLTEKKLREAVKKMGGLAVKFSSPYYTGMPDRIVLLPGGRIAFAEIKSTGEKPTPRQMAVIDKLNRLGFIARVIDGQETLDRFLREVRR